MPRFHQVAFADLYGNARQPPPPKYEAAGNVGDSHAEVRRQKNRGDKDMYSSPVACSMPVPDNNLPAVFNRKPN